MKPDLSIKYTVNTPTGRSATPMTTVNANSNLITSWTITGCTLHDTVNSQYCENQCRIKNHCTVFLALQKGKKREKVKVQFT